MTRADAIQQMKVYFEKHGWPDLDYNKLNSRASLSPMTGEPGWTVIKIERHRAILGATYTPKLHMSACRTYWMRYALNPATQQVEELAEELGPVHIITSDLVNEDLGNSFGLGIEPIGAGSYQIYDNVGKGTQEVSNVEEAISFASGQTQSWSDFFKELLQMEEGVSSQQIDQWVSEYGECLKDKVTEKAQQVWEEREEDSHHTA